ncbi:hypothetical protein C8F04DRAFT_1394281 [Mycena alexandri]|uniref:Uncharacterized protein n=1 Tax=Mycena alexandri TaxID=1745969 RepID=A0AAD6T0D1_9AGAR|nr:hypothetical protein C8F04DRAFT_1394281 [Mycena alexandri]
MALTVFVGGVTGDRRLFFASHPTIIFSQSPPPSELKDLDARRMSDPPPGGFQSTFPVGTDTLEYTEDTWLDCPRCHEPVHVGTAGPENFDGHWKSKKCKNRVEELAAPPKKKLVATSITTFFTKAKRALSPVSSAPPPVLPAQQTMPPPRSPSPVQGQIIHLRHSPHHLQMDFFAPDS